MTEHNSEYYQTQFAERALNEPRPLRPWECPILDGMRHPCRRHVTANGRCGDHQPLRKEATK